MQRLFHDDKPLRHKTFTDYFYSEENVDDPTSLDYYVVLDIDDDIRCESSTARCCRTLFFTRAVATYKKALGTINLLGHFMW